MAEMRPGTTFLIGVGDVFTADHMERFTEFFGEVQRLRLQNRELRHACEIIADISDAALGGRDPRYWARAALDLVATLDKP